MKPYYHDERAKITIYHGRAEEVLPGLLAEGMNFDLCLTDPPYGIGADKGKHRESPDRSGFYRYALRREYSDCWDVRPSDAVIRFVVGSADASIIWGGNYFAHCLPQSNHWLVWNKCNTMPTFSDCELAWTNLDLNSTKMFTCSANGLMAKEKDRFHPTQKPVELMSWCLSRVSPITVVDAFLGSGSTLVAAKNLGISAVGIEMEEAYAEIAALRLSQEVLAL